MQSSRNDLATIVGISFCNIKSFFRYYIIASAIDLFLRKYSDLDPPSFNYDTRAEYTKHVEPGDSQTHRFASIYNYCYIREMSGDIFCITTAMILWHGVSHPMR